MRFYGRKVLFLGAHPDDIELGCGALLAHIASQAEVLCVTLSDNQKNPALQDLVGEHRRSMAELGVGPERIVLGKFETRYFPRDRQQILEYLYDLNRQHRPEIVFVHTQSDIHQDHGVTTVEAMRAFRDTKATDPGLLDNLVGGGVPFGQTPHDTLVREGFEEAGLDAEHMRQARPGRTIVLDRDVPEGRQFERVHAFDLELPATLRPVNQDGEVAAIDCLAVAEAARLAAAGAMTVDAALVTLDFLANGGDAYAFASLAGPARADLVAPGTTKVFTTSGAEQWALARHLQTRFPRATPYAEADRPAAQDERIQNQESGGFDHEDQFRHAPVAHHRC